MADHSSIVNVSETDSECFLPPLEAVGSVYQWFLIILYSLTSLLAFLGNVTVIIVEIFGKQSANNFRKFLINLAISDIIIGVLCVPFTYTDFMLGQWIFPHWLCPVAQFVQLLSVFVTAYTLTIIGVERYIATLHPFSWVYEWLVTHTKYLLCLAWILGFAFASLLWSHTSTVIQKWDNITYFDCRYDIDLSPVKQKILMSTNFVITFALPLIVLIFSYSAISKKLMTDSMSKTDAPLRRNTNTQQCDRKRTIKIMFAVVLLYGLCWMPIKMYQILRDVWPSLFFICSETSYTVLVWVYFACHWMAMSNSFVNPIIYSFMSKSFREDFNKITRSIAQKLVITRNFQRERKSNETTNNTFV